MQFYDAFNNFMNFIAILYRATVVMSYSYSWKLKCVVDVHMDNEPQDIILFIVRFVFILCD